MRGGENREADCGEDGGGGDLDDGESSDGVLLDVTADKNHMHGEHHGAAENDGIAAIEPAEAFGRHGEEIKPDERGEGAGPDPGVDAAAAEHGEEQRDDHHARSGNESGFRGRGVFQAAGLKNVGGEHEETDLRAGPDGFGVEIAQRAPEENRHHRGGQGEAHGDVNENGDVGERVFHHDESAAPNESAKAKSEVGAEAFSGHQAKSVSGARKSDKAGNLGASTIAAAAGKRCGRQRWSSRPGFS